jgi:hypothetical protein
MRINSCRSCGHKKFYPVLNLGKQPWCNNFLKKKDLGKERIYPLNLVQCNNCELLQLNFTIPKEIMFKKHDYLSSTTKTLSSFFLKLAKENKKQFNLKKNEIILDIGGNDGTQLLQYKKLGFLNLINVESATNIAQISKKNKIKTFNNFFNYNFVKKNIPQYAVKLINASGVFFHLEELHSVLKAINHCLSKNGILIIQFMYAGTLVEKNNFDSIYHEHLCLYTIKSLSYLLRGYDLDIFDCYYEDIHSGSIIAKICRKKSSLNKKSKQYFATLKRDQKYTPLSFSRFGKKIQKYLKNAKKVLIKLKKKGNIIYCYGAPAKGNTFINSLKIKNSLIKKCVEINPLKIGKYLPGSHIPVVKETHNDKPDIYLLLSHNFEKEIIDKNKKLLKNGTRFLVPFPKPKFFGTNLKL